MQDMKNGRLKYLYYEFRGKNIWSSFLSDMYLNYLEKVIQWDLNYVA